MPGHSQICRTPQLSTMEVAQESFSIDSLCILSISYVDGVFAGISEINAFLMFSVTATVQGERGGRITRLWDGGWGGGTLVLGDIDIPPASSGHHFRGAARIPGGRRPPDPE